MLFSPYINMYAHIILYRIWYKSLYCCFMFFSIMNVNKTELMMEMFGICDHDSIVKRAYVCIFCRKGHCERIWYTGKKKSGGENFKHTNGDIFVFFSPNMNWVAQFSDFSQMFSLQLQQLGNFTLNFLTRKIRGLILLSKYNIGFIL